MKSIEVTIYEPEVFKIELAGTLSRRFGRDDVLSFIDDVMSKVRLIENPNELAFQIALDTGCRAIDSYFVATAKLTNSILVTNDKIAVEILLKNLKLNRLSDLQYPALYSLFFEEIP